jgi:hypothetical protein
MSKTKVDEFVQLATQYVDGGVDYAAVVDFAAAMKPAERAQAAQQIWFDFCDVGAWDKVLKALQLPTK